MSRVTVVHDNRPVAVYNAAKQELVGIFKKQVSVAKYIFHKSDNGVRNKIQSAIKFKRRIERSILHYPAAIRYANEQQVIILGEETFVIMEGYELPDAAAMRGFWGLEGDKRSKVTIKTV